MDFDVLAFIGRFQPFHVGHQVVIDEALKRAETVALVIGSHDQPRNARNPFTTAERIEMITSAYPNEVGDGRIVFVPQIDHTYNHDRWKSGVQAGVSAVAGPGDRRIGLIGHAKDRSSFYLKFFPHWGSVPVENVGGIHATDLREQIFGEVGAFNINQLPTSVAGWIHNWKTGKGKAAFEQVKSEMIFINRYKQQWMRAPYAPTFVTTDAVVVQSGHVLLVKRKEQPGRGLWALPGGFLDQEETLLEGALRELAEETRIQLHPDTLARSVVRSHTFDSPFRSLRGRTLTTAFLIQLQDRVSLPKINGADDAEKAEWVTFADVRRSRMFEDHYDIIETLVGL